MDCSGIRLNKLPSNHAANVLILKLSFLNGEPTVVLTDRSVTYC